MEIRLQTNAKEITIGLVKATRSGINSSLHQAADDIKRDLVKMVDSLLQGSDEYASLLTGVLKGDFGLSDPEPRLRQILETVKSSVGVSVIPVSSIGNELRGGIVITMIRSGFTDILGLPGSSYQGQNFNVPWLDWLLLQGDRIIVAGYHINYNPSPAQKRNSLSGIAIMEKGGGWRVPPPYSGTEDDNWITRTFDPAKIQGVVSSIVEKNIRRRL